MRIVSLPTRRSVFFIILSIYSFFAWSCSALSFKNIRAYEGPELPANQVAKLELNVVTWNQVEPGREEPISFLIDGKAYESMSKARQAQCLLILPGEHEVILIPKPRDFSGTYDSEFSYVTHSRTTIAGTSVPTPDRHVFKFTAEKGGEYLIAKKRTNNTLELTSWILWIEDRTAEKRITEEVQIDWKSRVIKK